MPASRPSKAPTVAAFVCECDEQVRSSCKGLPRYGEHEGKQYCVLHHPSKDKGLHFGKTLKRKLDDRDFDFRGVWFPDYANFSGVTFTKWADFTWAVFSTRAEFTSAVFSANAYFSFVSFGGGVSFSRATFSEGAYFGYAAFSVEAIFTSTVFDKEANFSYATFKAYVTFAEGGKGEVFDSNSHLSFQFARIENPDRFSFHTLTLRPHWFVNVDARKLEFINVNWNWSGVSVKDEIKSAGEVWGHRLLAIACRNLAVNSEENHRYEEASRFRYMVMEAWRLENLFGFAPWKLGWWYWLASGYGERVWRAFVVLIGVWLLAAAVYTQVGFVRWEPRVLSEQEAAEARRDEVGQPLRGWRALTYSLGVMTLQKPEPRPATDAAQAVVMLETILGPVQAALLALAIRRKFMR